MQKELLRLLEASDPVPSLKAMAETQILERVLPEAGELKLLGSVIAVEARLKAADAVRRFAALLKGDGKVAGDVATRLRFSNEMRERLIRLRTDLGCEPLAVDVDEPSLRRQLYRLGVPAVVDRIALSWARAGADKDAARWQGLLAAAGKYQRPKLPITGRDVMALGLSGERVGEVLGAVEAWWIEQDFAPDRDAVLAKAREALEGSYS